MDHGVMCYADPEPQADRLDAEGSGGPAADAAPDAAAPAVPMNGLQDASAASADLAGPDPDVTEHPAEHAVPQRTDAVEPGEPVTVLQPASQADEQNGYAKEPVRVSELPGQEDVEMSEAKATTDVPEELLEQQADTRTPMEA